MPTSPKEAKQPPQQPSFPAPPLPPDTHSLGGPLQEAQPQEPLSHPPRQKLRCRFLENRALWPRGPWRGWLTAVRRREQQAEWVAGAAGVGGSEGREQELWLEEQQGHLEAACLPVHPLCALQGPEPIQCQQAGGTRGSSQTSSWAWVPEWAPVWGTAFFNPRDSSLACRQEPRDLTPQPEAQLDWSGGLVAPSAPSILTGAPTGQRPAAGA